MHDDPHVAVNNEPSIQIENIVYELVDPIMDPSVNISYRHFNKLNKCIKSLLSPYLNSECDINNENFSQIIKHTIENLINSNDIDELLKFIEWCKTKEKLDIYNYYNYYTIIRIIINNNINMFRNMIILNDYHINQCMFELCKNNIYILFNISDKYQIFEELITFFINKQEYDLAQTILNTGYELAIKYNCHNSFSIVYKYKKQIDDLHIIPIVSHAA
jgi:hypothetical protein